MGRVAGIGYMEVYIYAGVELGRTGGTLGGNCLLFSYDFPSVSYGEKFPERVEAQFISSYLCMLVLNFRLTPLFAENAPRR